MPSQVISQPLLLSGQFSIVNLAPVSFSAMWMAVSVWRVRGPVTSSDLPAASAMKMISWSWMCLSTQPPHSTASRNSWAALTPVL